MLQMQAHQLETHIGEDMAQYEHLTWEWGQRRTTWEVVRVENLLFHKEELKGALGQQLCIQQVDKAFSLNQTTVSAL